MQRTIPVSADLEKLLKLPDCSLLSLPKPAPAKLRLPSGAKLTGVTDISKGIPTDCSMSFSLVLQLAPMLASIECLVKVLKLLEPLIKIIGDLPAPPSPSILLKFGEAAKEVMECIVAFTPQGGLLAFIKDVILLIVSFLKCFVGGLESIVAMLSGITLQLSAAEAAGNDELKRVLECAQQNAMNSADHLQGAIAPVTNLISLVEPLLGIANIEVAIPTIEPGADLEGLKNTLQTLKDVVVILEQIAEGIPA